MKRNCFLNVGSQDDKENAAKKNPTVPTLKPQQQQQTYIALQQQHNEIMTGILNEMKLFRQVYCAANGLELFSDDDHGTL